MDKEGAKDGEAGCYYREGEFDDGPDEDGRCVVCLNVSEGMWKGVKGNEGKV